MAKKTKKEKIDKKVEETIDKEEEVLSEKEKKKQSELIKNILYVLGGIIILIFLVFLISYYKYNFNYMGFSWNTEEYGDILIYHTSFPIIVNGQHTADYNVYLRNDPRKLKKNIPFEGDINLKEITIINQTQDFNCGGMGVIGVQGLNYFFTNAGLKFGKDPNASCDSEGRYMFIQMQEGNQTNIEQYGPSCYNLNINNCQVNEVSERFLIEVLFDLRKRRVI